MKMNKWKDKLLWLFLLPSVVGICLFYVFPYQKLVHYSLIKGLTDKKISGIENYQSLLKNTAFCIAVKNTAEIMALGVISMVPFSLYLANKINSMGKKNCLMCMLSPIVVPAACTAMVWRILFGSSGTLNQLLLLIGVGKVSWMDDIYGKIVIVILYIWKYTGYHTVIFLGALASVPKEYIETARLEGASERIIFLKIKTRCISPAIVFVTILAMMNVLKIFREIYLLTGDYPSKSMYLLPYFFNNMLRKVNYQMMSAAAILFSIAMIIIIGIMYIAEIYWGKDME